MTAEIPLDSALKALVDGNRRAILGLLLVEPLPVGAVADRLSLSQQTASHHLRTLRAAGMVLESREGTRHVFSIQREGFAVVQTYLNDFWPTKLDALRQTVEAASARKADG